MNYPHINLFCLPFSGADVYSYQLFEKHAPSSLQRQTLELPGRGSKMMESLLESVELMVENINYKKMIAWQTETTTVVETQSFPGNHFFIFNHTETIIDLMVQKLNTTVWSFS